MQLLAESPTLWFENVGHPNQFGIGSRAHLVHRRSAMNFDGDFADPEIARHLFVHFAGCDVQHHFLFARRKRFEALSQLRNVIFDDPPLSVALDGSHDGIKHVLIAKRLGEEVYRAMLHSVNGHCNVSVSGHHHHWNSNANLDQSGLEFKAVHVWQSDIEDNAARPVREVCRKEVLRRGIGLRLKSNRVKESLQRTAHGSVVVDDVHKWLLVGGVPHAFRHTP